MLFYAQRGSDTSGQMLEAEWTLSWSSEATSGHCKTVQLSYPTCSYWLALVQSSVDYR